jgi:hypothetical protein
MIEPGNDDAITPGHDRTPAVPEEPIANPGLPAHQWRPTDVDSRLEKRAERQVAAMFVLSMVCGVLFVVAYFTWRSATTSTRSSGWARPPSPSVSHSAARSCSSASASSSGPAS